VGPSPPHPTTDYVGGLGIDLNIKKQVRVKLMSRKIVKHSRVDGCKLNQGKDATIQFPPLAELEITSICNANCIFCPREQIHSPHHMSSTTWSQVLNRLKESQINVVKLAGFGEPTLHPNFQDILIDLCRSHFEVRLNTNLSFIHNLDIGFVLSNCTEVIASIHSLKPGIYKKLVGRDFFEQVRNNFSELIHLNRTYRRKLTIYIVVTRHNPYSFNDFEPYLKHISLRLSGCSNRVVNIFPNDIIDIEANRQYNHYQAIDREAPECGFASAACVIDCDGNYLLCTNDICRRSAISTVWSNSIMEAFVDFQNRMKCGEMLSFCCECENHNTFREGLVKMFSRNYEDS